MRRVKMNDDEVGYGKPPRQYQFKKGQSGNPKGRPKNSFKPLAILKKILGEKIPIRLGGEDVYMTQVEIILRKYAKRTWEVADAKRIELLFWLMQEIKADEAVIAAEVVPPSEPSHNVIFMIPHNNRGPVSGPFVVEDPTRPYHEWSRDKPMTAEELKKKMAAETHEQLKIKEP